MFVGLLTVFDKNIYIICMLYAIIFFSQAHHFSLQTLIAELHFVFVTHCSVTRGAILFCFSVLLAVTKAASSLMPFFLWHTSSFILDTQNITNHGTNISTKCCSGKPFLQERFDHQERQFLQKLSFSSFILYKIIAFIAL